MARRTRKNGKLPSAFYLLIVLVTPFMFLRDSLGEGGMFLVLGLLAAIILMVKSLLDTGVARHTKSLEAKQVYSPVMKQAPLEDGRIGVVVDWQATFPEIKKAIDHGDFDFARTWLQKFSYTTVGDDTSQHVRDSFKRLVTAFVEQDPLYKEICPALLEQIAAQPGMLQTAIYPLFPHLSKETLRYVLYFAEATGRIRREKKGRSYRLFGDELSVEEILLRHPFYSKVTAGGIAEKLRVKGASEKTISGATEFFLSQQEAFTRNAAGFLQNRENRPYLLYDAIDDGRTCEFCRRLDGKTVRVDKNGGFISYSPPFALGCRTALISLSERQWLARGGNDDGDQVSTLKPPGKCPCGSWIEEHDWR